LPLLAAAYVLPFLLEQITSEHLAPQRPFAMGLRVLADRRHGSLTAAVRRFTPA
jgi:hypothetical protein